MDLLDLLFYPILLIFTIGELLFSVAKVLVFIILMMIEGIINLIINIPNLIGNVLVFAFQSAIFIIGGMFSGIADMAQLTARGLLFAFNLFIQAPVALQVVLSVAIVIPLLYLAVNAPKIASSIIENLITTPFKFISGFLSNFNKTETDELSERKLDIEDVYKTETDELSERKLDIEDVYKTETDELPEPRLDIEDVYKTETDELSEPRLDIFYIEDVYPEKDDGIAEQKNPMPIDIEDVYPEKDDGIAEQKNPMNKENVVSQRKRTTK